MLYIVILSVTTMFFLNYIRRKKYGYGSSLRCAFLTIMVAALGFLGTKIMFFVENGVWGGQSFFGAVLLFPAFLVLPAIIFKSSLLKLLDYETISGLSILIWFKLNCYISGCCGGKVLYYSSGGVPFFFPSQIVEMFVGLIIIVVLIIFEHKKIFTNRLYPLFLVMYGVTRLILNYFRWEEQAFVFGLTAGAFWSILSIAIGIVWLVVYHMIRKYIIHSVTEEKN